MATLRDTAEGEDSGSASTLATADALSVTAGDLVVAQVKWEGTAASTINVDTGASTPTFSVANAQLAHSNGDLHGATFYWTATSTGTVNPRMVLDSARAWKYIRAYSFAPAGGATWALDASAAAQGTSSSPSAGTASATAAGASTTGFALYGSRDLTVGSGWTEAAEFNDTAAQVSQYRLQSGSGSITGDGSLGSSVEWVAQLAIFKEVGGATFTPRALLLGVG